MKKIVLTAALVLATASAAMAFEFDPNLANRYPAYAAPHGQTAPALTSRNVSLGGGQTIIQSGVDRASNPYAGGGVR